MSFTSKMSLVDYPLSPVVAIVFLVVNVLTFGAGRIVLLHSINLIDVQLVVV